MMLVRGNPPGNHSGVISLALAECTWATHHDHDDGTGEPRDHDSAEAGPRGADFSLIALNESDRLPLGFRCC